MSGTGNPDIDFARAHDATLSTSVYPFNDVAIVLAGYSDGSILQGSGAVIGPHTILTASHVVWNADLGEGAAGVVVSPGFPGAGTPIPGNYLVHYFSLDNEGGLITTSESQSDFAVIDYATDLSSLGSFGIDTSFTGGTVHLTGYPASAGGVQDDQVGVVVKDFQFNVLDYISVAPSPGSSGGPLWIDEGTPGDPQPYVVGVVSTSGHAALLTPDDLQTIQGWESSDATTLSQASTGVSLQAGAGQTTLQAGGGDDTIAGWSGGDYLRGGGGDDSIVGGTGFDDINGNKGNDTIDGGAIGSDWLVGGQGDDSITARAGQNLLYGNLGNDTLAGGAGGDVLRGGQGDDSIAGGIGNDFVSGDRGDDTESGGLGADIFHTSEDAGIDRVLDFHQAEGDRVQLDPGTIYTVSQIGADTVISLGPGSQMILVGVQLSSLSPGWIFGA